MTNDPYADAELYDLEYADHIEDIQWYSGLARRLRGPILDLGCGTGRLTLPMARTGATVMGIDRAPSMLDGLRRKLRHESTAVQAKVTVQLGDFQTLDLGRQFPLVLWPFNALHHCMEDQDFYDSLERITAHLTQGGTMALDAYLPDLELYDRDPEQRFEERSFVDPRTGEALHSWEQGWWEAPRRIHHVVYHYQDAAGHIEKAHLRFRMWEVSELREAFREAGLRLIHEASDFRGRPLSATSLKYVALLRRA